MMDKLQLGRWDSALTSWGQSRSVPQLLWGFRLLFLLLALLFSIYALIHFVSLLRSGNQAGATIPVAVSQTTNPAAQLDAAAVESWGWYSDRQASNVGVDPAQAAKQDDVQKTRLPMRLEGIVKSDDDEESVAIIEISKKAKQYKSGAKLPIAAGVYLRTIDVDRIILDNNGNLEELLLFSKDLSQQRAVQAAPEQPPQSGVIDQSNNRELSQMLGRYREQIQSNPGSINELIKFSAHTENGQLTGFRIGAAKNQQDFKRLGLQNGDVVTHVNGVQLTDYRKALTLYRDVGDLSEVRVQIQRGGQAQELIFSLPGEG